MSSNSGGGMTGTQKGLMKKQYSDKKGIADYLQANEEYPRGLRKYGEGQLAGIYGMQQPEGYEGQWGSQQGVIDQARQSPLYGAIMGNWENSREEGEEAIMRNAAMTGGLRGGNVQESMYDYNVRGTNQAQNQALLQAYGEQMQGLQGLSQTSPMQSQLAGMYGGNVSSGGGSGGGGGESGGGMTGALGGAMSGASMGASLGPWGAAGGAVIGGLGGYFG